MGSELVGWLRNDHICKLGFKCDCRSQEDRQECEDYSGINPVSADAADEIERLTAQLEKARGMVEEAFLEGYISPWRNGGASQAWNDSDAREALKELSDEGDYPLATSKVASSRACCRSASWRSYACRGKCIEAPRARFHRGQWVRSGARKPAA